MTKLTYLLKLIVVAVTVSTATVTVAMSYTISNTPVAADNSRTILGHRIGSSGQEMVVYAR